MNNQKPYLLSLLAAVFLLTSCGTVNSSLLEVRKRSRHENESIVSDLRSLKTRNEIISEARNRETIKRGKGKLEVIRRDPPPQGFNEPY